MVTTLQNTLYITTQGAYVSRDHDSLVVKVDKVEKLRIPRLHVGGVVCLGRVGVSPDALGSCADEGITVTFLSENGRFLAKVEGTRQGGIVLRRAQHRAADDPAASLALVRSFVAGKVANTRAFVLRRLRESDEGERAHGDTVVEALERSLRVIAEAGTIEQLRGYEGDAAARYWGWFASTLHGADEGVVFEGRSRRPPTDPVNAMLSFGYALLLQDCIAALATAGLDPDLGFLHFERPGRPSLALDLMEEFRVVLVDRLVVAMVNRKQVRGRDFVAREGGGIEMSSEARRALIVAYQERKRETIKHPWTGDELVWGLLVMYQARLLARAIRGELAPYPPFLLK
ncbi:MAG: type I-C CRISPR-associated endonuclease Cas1c [Deltaproteobacteria bacterium]|nr:type I-C CRISPR-associated endonuclease Cas1c [Deltaproteobacteria bacterium]